MAVKRNHFLELILIGDEAHKVTNEEIAVQAVVTYYNSAASAKTNKKLKTFFESMPRRTRKDLVKLLQEVGVGLCWAEHEEGASMYLTAAVRFKYEFLPPARKEWPFPVYDGNGNNERNYLPRSDPRRENFRLVKK